MEKKLEDLIPEGNLAVYHHLREIPLKFSPKELRVQELKKIKKIKEELYALSKRGFISELDAYCLKKNLWDARKSDDPFVMKILANQKILKKPGNQPDWNLNFFLYLTISDLKVYTRKPNYSAVADHLLERNIYNKKDEPYTAKAVEDIFKGIDGEKIKDLLLILAHIYKNSPRVLIPSEFIPGYDRKGFLGPFCCVLDLSNYEPNIPPIN